MYNITHRDFIATIHTYIQKVHDNCNRNKTGSKCIRYEIVW